MMKSERNSAEPGFLANLRRNLSDLVAPSNPNQEIETPAVAPADEHSIDEQTVNKVGKKVFELKVSEAVAIRPLLPADYIYPDAEEAARRHAELLRELPSDHPLFGVPLETFAVREGNADTLFRFRGNPRRYILVHLTGLGRTEIVFDGTFEQFVAREQTLA